jgi:hypothetical protein
LQDATLKAWEEYLHNAGSRMQARLDGQQPFLWTDESADRRLQVERGEIVVEPMAGAGTRSVPKGLIHDWIGAAFIPGATIDSLLCVIHDYDNYKDYYRPVVVDSKALASTSAGQEFSMVWRHKVLFVTAAIQTQYQGRDVVVAISNAY